MISFPQGAYITRFIIGSPCEYGRLEIHVQCTNPRFCCRFGPSVICRSATQEALTTAEGMSDEEVSKAIADEQERQKEDAEVSEKEVLISPESTCTSTSVHLVIFCRFLLSVPRPFSMRF